MREVIRIYLKSGQNIDLLVDDWKLKKSPLSNEITELTWTMADTKTLPYIRLDDVSAVLALGESDGTDQ